MVVSKRFYIDEDSYRREFSVIDFKLELAGEFARVSWGLSLGEAEEHCARLNAAHPEGVAW